jgi:hypothetical protein
MNKKFVYQVGNKKKSYTMMHGQPNIKIPEDGALTLKHVGVILILILHYLFLHMLV